MLITTLNVVPTNNYMRATTTISYLKQKSNKASILITRPFGCTYGHRAKSSSSGETMRSNKLRWTKTSLVVVQIQVQVVKSDMGSQSSWRMRRFGLKWSYSRSMFINARYLKFTEIILGSLKINQDKCN